MNKISAIVTACFSIFSVCVSAGSLNVHGEIKVNGTTVIDAQGNYVGTVPTQVDSINVSSYLNPAVGIKKMYTQKQTYGTVVEIGTRVDDYTDENSTRYTYDWPEQGYKYTSVETYYTPEKWILSGQTCNYSADKSSCEPSWYSYSSNQKTSIYWQDKMQIGGSFLDSYTQSTTQFYCGSVESVGDEYNSLPCTITGVDYLGDRQADTVVTNYDQVVMVLNRLAFKNDTVSLDDCVALQFNGNVNIPWTGIYCNGVGMVKGWTYNGYSVEVTSVEGSSTTSSKIRPVLSLRAVVPPVKK